MMALTLIDHALRHRAQNADVACPTPRVAAQASPEAIERLRAAAAVEDPEPDEGSRRDAVVALSRDDHRRAAGERSIDS